MLAALLTHVATGTPAAAAAPELRVVVVPGLDLQDLAALEERAAVGLLVPGAGPTVSGTSALAFLERGAVRNSLRGGLPPGDPLIAVEQAAAVPPAGPAIVLALPRGGKQPNDQRYPIAVLAPGFEGLLTSSSTRIPGLVSIVDVAPAALEGRGGLESQPARDPIGTLAALDRRIRDNGSARLVAALVAGAGTLLLALLRRGRAAVLALAGALAANLVLGALRVSEPWAAGVATAFAVAVAPLLARALRSRLALGGALTAVLAGYLAALGTDPSIVALSPLGPTQNSRFYGLSNLLSALLLVPALGAAALLRTLGWPAAALVAGLALVTVGGSRFGADGGGAIVLAVGLATLALLSAWPRWRAGLAAAAAPLVALVVLIAVDAGAGSSSHVTRTASGGAGGLAAALGDRAVLSYERAVDRVWLAALVVAGAVLLAVLSARLLRSGLPPEARALPLAAAVATAVSLVVNDSPLEVIAAGLVGFLALRALVLEAAASEDYDASAATRAANTSIASAPTRAPSSRS